MWSIISVCTFNLLAASGVVDGQETNIFDTPTFAQNISHRTNFCALHKMVEKGEINRRDALRGTSLHVGLFRYQLDKATGAIKEVNPGVGIDFLDELAIRSGFSWRNSYGILDSPSENQTWSGLLDWSVDTYDLVGDWFLQTTERMGDGILFPQGWYDGSLIMVKEKPQEDYSNDLWAFLMPFTYGVWITIIGTMVASGLVFYLLDYLNSVGHRKEMELGLLENLYSSFISFVGHLVHLPKSGSGQILSFSVCFLSLLLLTAYTANLASFLVVRNAPTVIINDITDAIKNDLSFCVLRSSTSEDTLRNEYPMARLIQKESIDDTYLGVKNGECDIVLTTIGTWEKNKRTAKFNGECRLEWAGRVVKFVSAGFSLRDSVDLCSSLLRDVLGLHMVEIKLDRTFDVIWGKNLDRGTTNECTASEAETSSENDEDTAKLNIYNMGGIFIFHLALMTLAVGLSLFNWFRHRRRSRTDARAETNSTSPYSNHDMITPPMNVDAPPQHEEHTNRRNEIPAAADPSKQKKEELKMMVIMGVSIAAVWTVFALLVFV